MASLFALVIITFISLLAVRIGSIALTLTGLSWDTASFQSYSAFFGVGFTTREAEMVVNHPVRRRIIRDLILAGNIGLTSALATLVVSVVGNESELHPMLILAGLVGAVLLLIFIIGRPSVRKLLDKVIRHTLLKAGLVKALDYELLLRIGSGYSVSELEVLETSPLAGKPLRVSRPWDHGVIILALRRDGDEKPGIPGPEDSLLPGDVITVYGQEARFAELN